MRHFVVDLTEEERDQMTCDEVFAMYLRHVSKQVNESYYRTILRFGVRNQKSLIESVVDAAQVAIVLLDDQERVVLDNQEYKKLVSDLGKEPAIKILTALRSQLGSAFTKAHEKHRNITACEVCIELSNHHSRWFSCAVSWFEEHDVGADAFYEPQRRHYLLLTIQDISQLKQQQEALRINGLRALLSEQERIQGLRETLAGAVYQLEGPLNMLSAVAHMLERRLSSTPSSSLLGGNALLSASALDEAIQQSREALERLRACIPDQLDAEMQPVDLNEVMSDLLKITTGDLLGAGIVVEWLPAQRPAVMTGHATQLTNLFKQLLANAIDAINLRRGGRREIRIACLPHEDHFEIVVEDSGPGIAEDIRNKAFQPFFTTKGAAQQHLGLGLAMAQEVVTQHGGTIDFDPTFNNGCRVRVQLARAKGALHV